MGKTSNNHVANGAASQIEPSAESTTPENQLANLRNILFGSTAKTIEERLEQLETTLETYQATQLEKEQALVAESQSIESRLNAQIQKLRAENSQLKNELSDVQNAAKQLENNLLIKVEEQQSFVSSVQERMNQNQQHLGALLMQLGSQLQQGHEE